MFHNYKIFDKKISRSSMRLQEFAFIIGKSAYIIERDLKLFCDFDQNVVILKYIQNEQKRETPKGAMRDIATTWLYIKPAQNYLCG